jgi:hypothetical protein
MGIVGMLNGAKNGRKLYEDMIRAGYKDKEFPVWRYSPTRDVTSQQKLVEDAPSHVEDASCHVEDASCHVEDASCHVEDASSPIKLCHVMSVLN